MSVPNPPFLRAVYPHFPLILSWALSLFLTQQLCFWVVRQSVSLSISQSVSPIFCQRNSSEPPNKISWSFVVIKYVMCRSSYWQESLIQFFSLGVMPLMNLEFWPKLKCTTEIIRAPYEIQEATSSVRMSVRLSFLCDTIFYRTYFKFCTKILHNNRKKSIDFEIISFFLFVGMSTSLSTTISDFTLSKGDNSIWILYLVYVCIQYEVIVNVYCELGI